MSNGKNARHYSVQTKVRPYAEIVEVVGSRGLQTAAVIYGDTKKEATERAYLLAQYLRLEATPEYVRKRLKLLSWYHWFRAHSRQHPGSVYTLGMWIIGCTIEPQVMGRWLAHEFLVGPDESMLKPSAAADQQLAVVIGEEEII